MIGWGIFCIFLAFFTMVSTANAGIETGYGAAILWAAIGSVLIARGRAKKQQKQKQLRKALTQKQWQNLRQVSLYSSMVLTLIIRHIPTWMTTVMSADST